MVNIDTAPDNCLIEAFYTFSMFSLLIQVIIFSKFNY